MYNWLGYDGNKFSLNFIKKHENICRKCLRKNIAIFLFCFFSGQEEIRYPNGTLQISFADGSVKRIDTDGTENIAFPDGTKVIVHPNGDRTLLLPSGQKEIHTATFKVNFI